MTLECPVCGSEIQYGNGNRFSIRLNDVSESTIHRSQTNVCADCWEDVLDFIHGGNDE